VRNATAIASAILAVIYVAARPSPSRPPLPPDLRALAQRLESHPADWLAASAIAERSLDAPVRDPLALWHASGALAISLAPFINEPRASFARAGFFHWNELSDADRKLVLDSYAPALRDPLVFGPMHRALFALTGDLGYLRRARPPGEMETRYLVETAVMNGLFDDYRQLRAELPPNGFPGHRIDSREVDAARAVAVTVAMEERDRVPPYVEIDVDGALRAEGAVETRRTFDVPAAGRHTITVRLVNPTTGLGTPRRVRVVSVQAL